MARTCGDFDTATNWFRSEPEGNKELCERVAGGQDLAQDNIDRGGWFPRPTAVTSFSGSVIVGTSGSKWGNCCGSDLRDCAR